MQRHDPHPSLQLRLQPLGLPPLDAIDHSVVRKAASAAESIETKFREAQERHYVLEQHRPELEAEDRKALGAAMRRGEPDPGDAALPRSMTPRSLAPAGRPRPPTSPQKALGAI